MNAYRQVLQLIDARRPLAVGLILSTEGSTPREAGVRAVIEADGGIHGTLGGGAVEAEAQRLAVEACRSGQPIVFEMDLEGTVATGAEPICGGTMRVLLDPTAAKDRGAYAAATDALERRDRGVFLTTIRADDGSVWTEVEWRAEEAHGEHPAAGEARLVRGDARTEVLVEPVVPNALLIVVGGGHVGQAVAVQAALIGFDVTVLDDRPEFTDAALFPEGTTARCGDMAAELAAEPLGADTYVVIVTRGHQHDAEALRACVGREAAYVGMIGSLRKVALLRQSFLDAGWATEGELDRVCAPIGLDIGAETVPEIATSIVAQLIAVRRTGGAQARPR